MDIDKWIEQLTEVTNLERNIDVLKRMKGYLQNDEKYQAFCEGFLIPREYLEPKRNDTMINKIFERLRKKIPKDLLNF